MKKVYQKNPPPSTAARSREVQMHVEVLLMRLIHFFVSIIPQPSTARRCVCFYECIYYIQKPRHEYMILRKPLKWIKDKRTRILYHTVMNLA